MTNAETGPVRGQPRTTDFSATTPTAKTKSVSQEAAPTAAQLELAGRLGVIVPEGATNVSLYRRIGGVLQRIWAVQEEKARHWAESRARA